VRQKNDKRLYVNITSSNSPSKNNSLPIFWFCSKLSGKNDLQMIKVNIASFQKLYFFFKLIKKIDTSTWLSLISNLNYFSTEPIKIAHTSLHNSHKLMSNDE